MFKYTFYMPIPNATLDKLRGTWSSSNLTISRRILGEKPKLSSDFQSKQLYLQETSIVYWIPKPHNTCSFYTRLQSDKTTLAALLIQDKESLELLMQNSGVRNKIQHGELPVLLSGPKMSDYLAELEAGSLKTNKHKVTVLDAKLSKGARFNTIIESAKTAVRKNTFIEQVTPPQNTTHLDKNTFKWLQKKHSIKRRKCLIVATLPALFTTLALSYGIPEAMAGAAMSGKVIAFIVAASVLAILLALLTIPTALTGCKLSAIKRCGLYQAAPTSDKATKKAGSTSTGSEPKSQWH